MAIVAAASLAGCGDGNGDATPAAGSPDAADRGLPQGSEPVTLDPADFTTKIDNPYWPMKVGSRWEYRETDASGAREKVVVEVTAETKRIANGITARVIRDTATEKGVPVEVTDDWFAQDDAGHVWYLGEYVTNYEDGNIVDHAGSFEAGIGGAMPGFAIPAKPAPASPTARSTSRAKPRTRAPS